MRLVAISDTHGHHDALDLPAGDVLVHTGDFSRYGDLAEAEAFLTWLTEQPHPHKLLIAGNHDFAAEKQPEAFRALVPDNVTYLQDSAVEVDGRTFYGAPWTPEFCSWAFMLERGEPIRTVWDKIPGTTDVLLTHGPPYGHNDLAKAFKSAHQRAVGCLELLHAVQRVRPLVHIFGHIHESYGASMSDEVPGTQFINASTCTLAYAPDNPPVVIDLPD